MVVYTDPLGKSFRRNCSSGPQAFRVCKKFRDVGFDREKFTGGGMQCFKLKLTLMAFLG